MKLRRGIVDVVKFPILVIVVSIVAAVAGGAYWGVVDWLRNFGADVSFCPYFDQLQAQAVPVHVYASGSFTGCIEDLINAYNLAFRGATRFGSGLGMIAGAFIAMGYAGGKNLPCRTVTGLVAGSIIGARSALMLGSGVPIFIVGLVAGAVLAALYMVVCEGPARISKLPMLDL